MTVLAVVTTLKLVLGSDMLRDEVSGRVAVSVSPLVLLVKRRLLKTAVPLDVEAVAGEVVRSALASVKAMLTELAVNAAPFSVSVTAGAGDIEVPGAVPADGGATVKASA